MTAFTDPQSRAYARIAGALYATIAVSGALAIAYIPSQLQVPGDAAATMANILANRRLFMAGIAGDVVMMLAEVLATAMLFFMFRHVNQTLALAATFARLSMALVMAGMLFLHAGLLALIEPGSAFASFTADQRTDLAALLLYMHNAGVWIWQLFFFVHLSLLGWLVVRSNLYPKVLGWGMTVGAFGYLADSLYAFALPEAEALGAVRVGLLAVVTLSEVGFALWLLIVGPRARGAAPRPASPVAA